MRNIALSVLFSIFAGFCSLAAESGDEVLTNQDVIDLLQAGLANELVTQKIRSSANTFDLSTKAMIKLKKDGVPDDIIALMLEQRQKEAKSSKSKIALEIQHLAEDRPEVRDAALIKLRSQKDLAIPQLRTALGHSRSEIRVVALNTLAEFGDDKQLAVMRGMLADSVPEVRYAAAEALFSLNDEEGLVLARKATVGGLAPLDGYIRLLGLFKDENSKGFIRLRLLEDTDKLSRAQAAWALGSFGDKALREPLEHALAKDRSPEVRREAALALGKLAIPESAKTLIQACRTDPEIRKETMLAMEEMPARIVVPFLIGTLQHRLNPAETKATLTTLRKLTHQDFGNNYPRWALWLEKNRVAMIEDNQGDNPDAFAKEETGKIDITDEIPGILDDNGGEGKIKDEFKEEEPWGETKAPPPPSATKEDRDDSFRVIPRHARQEPETAPAPPPPPEPSTKKDELPEIDLDEIEGLAPHKNSSGESADLNMPVPPKPGSATAAKKTSDTEDFIPGVPGVVDVESPEDLDDIANTHSRMTAPKIGLGSDELLKTAVDMTEKLPTVESDSAVVIVEDEMPGRVLIATSDNAPESDKRIASAPIPSAQAAGGAVESAEEPVDLAEMSPLATDNIATTEARWRTGDEPFPENTVEDTVVLIAEDAVGIKPAEKPESDFYLMESKPSPVKNKPVLKETAKQAAAPTVEDKKEESEKKVATVDEGDSEITAAEKKPAPKSNEKAPISRFFDNIFGAKNKVENENKNEKSTLFNTDTYND